MHDGNNKSKTASIIVLHVMIDLQLERQIEKNSAPCHKLEQSWSNELSSCSSSSARAPATEIRIVGFRSWIPTLVRTVRARRSNPFIRPRTLSSCLWLWSYVMQSRIIRRSGFPNVVLDLRGKTRLRGFAPTRSAWRFHPKQSQSMRKVSLTAESRLRRPTRDVAGSGRTCRAYRTLASASSAACSPTGKFVGARSNVGKGSSALALAQQIPESVLRRAKKGARAPRQSTSSRRIFAIAL